MPPRKKKIEEHRQIIELTTKTKRAPRFTDEELDALAEAVEKRKNTIQNKFSDTLTHEKKRKAWAEVAKEVNAVGNFNRSEDKIRSKWNDWSSETKKKSSLRKKGMGRTGGGGDEDIPKISPTEEKVLAIIGKTATEGIEGAEILDTEIISNIQDLTRDTNSQACESQASASEVTDDQLETRDELVCRPIYSTCPNSPFQPIDQDFQTCASETGSISDRDSLDIITPHRSQRANIQPAPRKRLAPAAAGSERQLLQARLDQQISVDDDSSNVHQKFPCDNPTESKQPKLTSEQAQLVNIEKTRLDIERERLQTEKGILQQLQELVRLKKERYARQGSAQQANTSYANTGTTSQVNPSYAVPCFTQQIDTSFVGENYCTNNSAAGNQSEIETGLINPYLYTTDSGSQFTVLK